jgi:hypothetical protein
VNTFFPTFIVPNFIKQTLLDINEHICPDTIIVGDFNKPLSSVNRPSDKNINKETLELDCTIQQMDLKDSYRTFYPVAAEYIFFSETHETFFKIDYILG